MIDVVQLNQFATVFEALQREIHAVNTEHGFHDEHDNKYISLAMAAMIGSEVGELVDALRKPGPSEHVPAISGVSEELADIIIRVMDFAEEHHIDLVEAIFQKFQYNKSRPHMHGGKLA